MNAWYVYMLLCDQRKLMNNI